VLIWASVEKSSVVGRRSSVVREIVGEVGKKGVRVAPGVG